MVRIIAQSPQKIRAAAFTLVEVVLALGIISFGLVAMTGLLSAGLRSFNEAVNDTTHAQIVQQLAGQLSQANYSAIASQAKESHFFSREGIELTSGDAANQAAYTATVQPPSQLLVPGANSTPNSLGNVLTFVIAVTSKTDPRNPKTFAIQVANNGY